MKKSVIYLYTVVWERKFISFSIKTNSAFFFNCGIFFDNIFEINYCTFSILKYQISFSIDLLDDYENVFYLYMVLSQNSRCLIAAITALLYKCNVELNSRCVIYMSKTSNAAQSKCGKLNMISIVIF